MCAHYHTETGRDSALIMQIGTVRRRNGKQGGGPKDGQWVELGGMWVLLVRI